MLTRRMLRVAILVAAVGLILRTRTDTSCKELERDREASDRCRKRHAEMEQLTYERAWTRANTDAPA